ncbi:MAG: SpoIIE family protein phosphatase [Spirochaetia bacterium]|nr:SpoIIE family protein phosphatase [Spirochaetia bacterium]
MIKNYLLIILGVFLFLPCSLSSEVIELDDSVEIIDISQSVEFYEDINNDFNIHDFMNRKYKKLEKQNLSYPAFSFSSSAFWGKFSLDNQGPNSKKWYLIFDFPLLDEIDLFFLNASGEIVKKEQGNDRDYFKRDLRHRKNIFFIEMEPETKRDFYIRVKSADTVEIPVLLASSKSFLKKDRLEMSIYGLYYGIILAMIIYNLYLSFILKEKTYIFYVIFISSYAFSLLGLSGILKQIFPFFSNDFVRLSRILAALSTIIFSSFFTIYFLELKSRSKKFYRLCLLLIALAVINILTVLFSYEIGVQILLVMMLISVILALMISVLWYKTYILAKYYLWAWGVFLAGIIIYSLKIFNFYIPGITEYVMHIGSAIEASVLSLGLAYRIKLSMKEKEEAEIKSLKLKQDMTEREFQIELKKLERKAHKAQIKAASEMQSKMIEETTHEKISAIYVPIEEIGGDFYNIIELKGKTQTGIFFSDVTGHGIISSLYTVMVKSVISNALSDHKETAKKSKLLNPKIFLNDLNIFLMPYLQNNLISAIYAVYNHKTREMLFSSAAHPPPIILGRDRKKRVDLKFLDISPQGHSLGVGNEFVKKKKEYKNKKIILPKKSRILFYSDGLLDSVGYQYEDMEKGIESFKNTPLYEVFDESFSFSAQELSNRIKSVVTKIGIMDDVCVLILET